MITIRINSSEESILYLHSIVVLELLWSFFKDIEAVCDKNKASPLHISTFLSV